MPHARLLLLLVLYATGLTHAVSRPWTGMHDWNGAFFSQLARNFLRYPMDLHHGMPIVAVGEAVPPPEERSIYATHPPGLVWLVAGTFALLGEAEWVARLVPILASLGTLALFVTLVHRAWGRFTATLAGLIYAVMPMSVYFGRMLDHEAVCLFFMMAAVAAWQVLVDRDRPQGHRLAAAIGWTAAIAAGIWVDWSGFLFAGLFFLNAVVQRGRRQISTWLLLLVFVVPVAAGAGMLRYLVAYGLAGSWSDLESIFLSRAVTAQGEMLRRDPSAEGGAWTYTVENLSWPVLLFAAAGLSLAFLSRDARGGGRLAAGRIDEANATAPLPGGWVLLATGAIWLAVFWGQYERHNYWLFYLGPPAALFAAIALCAIGAQAMAFGRRVGQVILGCAVATVLVFALAGTDDYFSRVSYSSDAAAAWQQIGRRLDPRDRVLLYRSPILIEDRGGYRFRNIVPPQQAYYLDRAFGAERDLQAVQARSDAYAMFVIPVFDALSPGGPIAELERHFDGVQMGPFVVFNFRETPSTQE